MSSSEPLVVEVVRTGLVESTHLVDVAVTDADGALVAWAGEPETVAYLRSVAKPIQATVCMELGWEPPGEPQLALACASHNGEQPHVEAVRVTLAAAGLTEDDLLCPAGAQGRIYHNCSGKHAAMLATTVANGREPPTYLEWDNDIHRTVRSRVDELAGGPARAVGKDGCGVPTFAFTLAETARIYASLPMAAPGALEAMRAHPYLVAGAARICTSVMSSVPDVVLKVGAEGLMCGALLDRGQGFALKARDGAARGREIATVRVLEMLGVLGRVSPDRILKDIMPRVLPEPGAKPELRCRGELKQA
jgi:L-asparaginase II